MRSVPPCFCASTGVAARPMAANDKATANASLERILLLPTRPRSLDIPGGRPCFSFATLDGGAALSKPWHNLMASRLPLWNSQEPNHVRPADDRDGLRADQGLGGGRAGGGRRP